MRNRANRLEELFVSMVENDNAASRSAKVADEELAK